MKLATRPLTPDPRRRTRTRPFRFTERASIIGQPAVSTAAQHRTASARMRSMVEGFPEFGL
jgi:hypothetical protein